LPQLPGIVETRKLPDLLNLLVVGQYAAWSTADPEVGAMQGKVEREICEARALSVVW